MAEAAPGHVELAQADLGVERTYLAYERTLMAWTRTAASLISFGFTIYKFFEGSLGENRQQHVLGYKTFSTVMISVGLAALVLATIQHRHDTKMLEQKFSLKPRYLAPLTAALIGGLGILGILAIAFRQ